MPTPEVWLRGSIPGVPEDIMPVAHGLLGAAEEIQRLVADLTPEMLWRSPGGAASIGFHLTHLIGSTSRLFTYAAGEELSETQRGQLEFERKGGDKSRSPGELLDEFERTVDLCIDTLRDLDPSTLDDFRGVGKAQLPSSVRGLLSHAAEHAARHVGQMATTLKVLQSSRDDSAANI